MSEHQHLSGQTTARVLIASLVGTTVEFYDFYIYATAASLVFGPLFFPASIPSAELIGAYASFGIAFLARPFGGAVFGHFGDRIGRKTTLVASLLLMGVSTAAIGFLPTFEVVGWTAPLLLCVLRFGQGLALGGEWTGAALLALENAPPGWRARYAMFAPLGAPIGFILANGLFLILTVRLTPEQFMEWGWRIPFLASVVLVFIGLWVRSNLLETREFAQALTEAAPPRVPLVELMRTHGSQVLTGTFGVVACFSLYYTATAFSLGYGTTELGFSRSAFLIVELGAILFMAAAIILASWLSDVLTPTKVLILGCGGTIFSGVVLAPMLGSGSLAIIFVFLASSLFVMGFVNGPLGAWLPNLFPPRIRYSGTSVAFNLGGIIGGAFSPVICQALATNSGLPAVGFFLAITGGISLLAFDVSARREASSALLRSDKRYRSIFDQTHVSLCELDLSSAGEHLAARSKDTTAEGARIEIGAECLEACRNTITVRGANAAAAKLLECTGRDEVIGSFERFLSPDGADLQQILAGLVKGGAFERQMMLRSARGRSLTVILSIAFPDDESSLDRVACGIIDVTDRESAREVMRAAQGELARAGRLSSVGAVSASIAHEVNQPIGAMVMNAQACVRWLSHDPPNIESAAKAAQRAVNDGLRAAEIVQRTKEQLRRGHRKLEAVDLRELVEGAVDLLEHEVTATSVTIYASLDRSRPLVHADRVELQQVVVNLLTNGLQALKKIDGRQRELYLSIEMLIDERVRFSVRDNGTGIDAEHLGKLFTPFFTTKHEGMGIGLSICKTIVEAHAGSLAARNSDGGGAIFEVILPVIAATDANAAMLEVGASPMALVH
jgi:signal transduction histidine kinase/MFS family permease